MLGRTLNLGIVAHVDAGKTTLTERLLYAAGVIDAVGSVDKGTTQTDSLALEQQRGITIKSAVVSFAIDDVTVNLIDTPGHPDFIAEVERVLAVLDGAVLVISAVEGVQPQTPLLMRALQRLRVPTLLFVNKMDRRGADEQRVLEEIAKRLTPAAVPMGSAADDEVVPALAEHNDELLADYVDGASIPPSRIRNELAAQTRRALVHPVSSGSAKTGAGVRALMSGIAELLPGEAGNPEGPLSGAIFKIERGPAGEKIAYARVFSGTLRTRDRVRLPGDTEPKVTAIRVFEDGSDDHRPAVGAGQIAKLWGLGEARIGDAIGETKAAANHRHFAPPSLEAVVFPTDPGEGRALWVALEQLAEQDPLIDVRRDAGVGQMAVSLYGEVQKEVIQATLANDFGLEVGFRDTTPICVERPLGTGEAVEILHAESNPFNATIGLRVDPAPDGAGVDFRLEVDSRTIPLYVYKRREDFGHHMGQYVRRTLEEGLFAWKVTDCIVTMTKCEYSVPDGPPSKRGPLSTPADYRKLTPIVLMQALERAGTVVCEPTVRASIEMPTQTIGVVLPALARLGAAVKTPSSWGELSTIETVLPAARVHELQRELPGLTGGEGVLESSFAGYEPVSGDPPTRPRTTANPLNLGEYMHKLARHS